ncbi:hypothetical protein SMC87_004395 [Cronobacter dublinensis]|nr:hypothetical protein [Cronobacter dublinensis]
MRPDGLKLDYDGFGRLTRRQDKNGVVQHFAYDDEQRVKEIRFEGNSEFRKVEYRYDPLGRVNRVFKNCDIYWYHTELNRLPERVTNADGQTRSVPGAKRSASSAYRSGRRRRTYASRAVPRPRQICREQI